MAPPLGPVPVSAVVSNACMGMFFLTLNLVDLSAVQFILGETLRGPSPRVFVTPITQCPSPASPCPLAGADSTSMLPLAQGWVSWKLRQPLLPGILAVMGLPLPFGLFKLFTADVVPLLRAGHRAPARHVYGTTTLAALLCVLYVVVGVIKPLLVRLSSETVDALELQPGLGSGNATAAAAASAVLAVSATLVQLWWYAAAMVALNALMLCCNVAKYATSLPPQRVAAGTLNSAPNPKREATRDNLAPASKQD
jgi:hypothetical protein